MAPVYWNLWALLAIFFIVVFSILRQVWKVFRQYRSIKRLQRYGTSTTGTLIRLESVKQLHQKAWDAAVHFEIPDGRRIVFRARLSVQELMRIVRENQVASLYGPPPTTPSVLNSLQPQGDPPLSVPVVYNPRDADEAVLRPMLKSPVRLLLAIIMLMLLLDGGLVIFYWVLIRLLKAA